MREVQGRENEGSYSSATGSELRPATAENALEGRAATRADSGYMWISDRSANAPIGGTITTHATPAVFPTQPCSRIRQGALAVHLPVLTDLLGAEHAELGEDLGGELHGTEARGGYHTIVGDRQYIGVCLVLA